MALFVTTKYVVISTLLETVITTNQVQYVTS